MKFLKDEKTRRIIVSGSILVVLYFLLNNLSDIYGVFTKLLHVMSPFIVGAAIAYILNVPMRKVERGLFKNPDKFSGPKWHGRRRALAIFITISIAFLVIGCVLYMVIPQLADTIAQLIKQIPAGVQNVTVWAENTFSKYPVITEKIDYWAANWQNILESITTFVKNYINQIIAGGISAVSGLVSGVVNFLIAFIFSLYILVQKEKLGDQFKKIIYAVFEKKTADWMMVVGERADKTFTGFISGQCVEAIIIGLLFFIVMTIFRIPYTLLISLLIGVTALVPIVGTIIGCVVGVILILLVNPMKVLVFLIIFVVIQQFEGNIIYPHVVGNSVGLSGIWVLVSLTVGGSLFGIMGMVVFIPLVSVLYAFLREYIYGILKEKGMVDKDYKLTVGRKKEETKNVVEAFEEIPELPPVKEKIEPIIMWLEDDTDDLVGDDPDEKTDILIADDAGDADEGDEPTDKLTEKRSEDDKKQPLSAAQDRNRSGRKQSRKNKKR